MLLTNLKMELVSSMKARDTVKTDTLRYLLAAIRNDAIAKYGAEGEAKVTEKDILDVIKKQIKTHTESIEAFTKANRMELAEKENNELRILETYVPKPLSDDQLKTMLSPIAAQGGDFGPLMGRAMAQVAGQADGNRVAAILKALLSQE